MKSSLQSPSFFVLNPTDIPFGSCFFFARLDHGILLKFVTQGDEIGELEAFFAQEVPSAEFHGFHKPKWWLKTSKSIKPLEVSPIILMDYGVCQDTLTCDCQWNMMFYRHSMPLWATKWNQLYLCYSVAGIRLQVFYEQQSYMIIIYACARQMCHL